MVRKLKYHEKKLLKKVDFINWEVDNNLHELKILKKYFIQRREDYTLYNKLSRQIRTLARLIKDLDMKDPFRKECTERMLKLLYSMGLISRADGLEVCDKVSASSFCRRRLPVIMVRSRMAPSLKISTKFIEQGQTTSPPEENEVMEMPGATLNSEKAEFLFSSYDFYLSPFVYGEFYQFVDVRVGPNVTMDPAFLVTRNMEDFITWVDESAIKKHIAKYNEEMDDFDLM